MKPFPALVHDELERARSLHPGSMPTLHHGYAVLREEVDEFWEEVRKRDANLAAVLSELVQIGAMAQRVAEEVRCLNSDTVRSSMVRHPMGRG